MQRETAAYPIRMVIVGGGEDAAEQLVGSLKNSGLPVRPAFVDEFDETTIINPIMDVVVVRDNNHLAHVAEVAHAQGIPVIHVADQPASELFDVSVSSGADAVAWMSIYGHLAHEVRRIVDGSHTRRELRRREMQLEHAQRCSETLLTNCRDCVAYIAEGLHVLANPAYLDLFGLEDPSQLNATTLLDLIAPDSQAAVRRALKSAITGGECAPVSVTVTRPNQTDVSCVVRMTLAAAVYDSEPCVQIVLAPDSSQTQEGRELERLKTTDLVSGLSNRAHLWRDLERAIVAVADRQLPHAGLMLIEIDDFSAIINQVGLAMSDVLIGDFADRLAPLTEEGDHLARLTDNIFCILSRNRDLASLRKLADRIRYDIEQSVFEVGRSKTQATVSIGIAPILESIGNAVEVMAAVEGETRRAKDAGGNLIRTYCPAQSSRDTEHDAHWISRIESALTSNSFTLLYQPMISMFGEECQLNDVLLRMTGDEVDVLPDAFLPVAERHGLMPQIDRWVLRCALAQLAQHRDPSSRLMVRISIVSLADQTLVPWLAEQLRRYRLGGQCLIVQLPESVAVTNLQAVRQFQSALKQLQCGFALTRFGLGINSFKLLDQLAADFLKIDRSLLNGLTAKSDHKRTITRICDHAHALGKTTIAEFVEDAAAMSTLYTCGVDYVQGNFLQPPQSLPHTSAPKVRAS